MGKDLNWCTYNDTYMINNSVTFGTVFISSAITEPRFSAPGGIVKFPKLLAKSKSNVQWPGKVKVLYAR